MLRSNLQHQAKSKTHPASDHSQHLQRKLLEESTRQAQRTIIFQWMMTLEVQPVLSQGGSGDTPSAAQWWGMMRALLAHRQYRVTWWQLSLQKLSLGLRVQWWVRMEHHRRKERKGLLGRLRNGFLIRRHRPGHGGVQMGRPRWWRETWMQNSVWVMVGLLECFISEVGKFVWKIRHVV